MDDGGMESAQDGRKTHGWCSSRTLPSIKCRLTKVSRKCLNYFSENCTASCQPKKKFWSELEYSSRVHSRLRDQLIGRLSLWLQYTAYILYPLFCADFPQFLTTYIMYHVLNSYLHDSPAFVGIGEIGPQHDTTTPSKDDYPDLWNAMPQRLGLPSAMLVSSCIWKKQSDL